MQSLSVTQFVEFLNAALSAAVFPSGVVVDGEVAEYRLSQGKWIWFKLKDEQSLIECFATAWQIRQPLEDGMTVRIFGQPKLFGRSGKFTVNVERVEPLGEGALRRTYELLKKRLESEGLFAADRKRPLPEFPQRIGLIASGESAAFGDFCRILGGRWGGLAVEHYDVAVQGSDAVSQIVQAFDWFNAQKRPPELLVLTRGGGSLEDLAAFNSEAVARAVFGSRLPVVVGVGHERDETLADFVADVRAATPSHAAEIIVPDRREVARDIVARVGRLNAALVEAVGERRAAVEEGQHRLDRSLIAEIRRRHERLMAWSGALERFAVRLAALRTSLEERSNRIRSALDGIITERQRRLAAAERLLRNLDPRRLLERGYAIVRCRGRLVRQSDQVDLNDSIAIQLAHGSLAADVTVKLP